MVFLSILSPPSQACAIRAALRLLAVKLQVLKAGIYILSSLATFLLVVKPSIAVIVPDGSALEEITEQEEEMLVLVYWHHHQTVLSGDEQPDFKPQIRHIRGGAGQHRQRE